MPNVQNLHLDKALSNISIGYKNEAYIADQIFLPVSVNKQSDRYYVFGKEMFRQHDDARAAGAEANEIGWTFSDDTYYCEGHALRSVIADEEKQNADEGFDLEVEATQLVTEGILLNKEIDAASKLLTAANYDADLRTTLAGVTQWSHPDSNPVLAIAIAMEKMHKKSGLRPNTLVISEPVYNVLRVHPKLTALFAGLSPVTVLNMQQIAAALNVDRILMGSALKSAAMNPAQADTLSYIWGTAAVLCYIPTNPGKKTQAIGYSFMWNKDGGAIQVRKWYETSRRATVVEAERWYSHKVISNTAGYLFSDAVTPIGN